MDTLAHLLFGGFIKNLKAYRVDSFELFLSGCVRPDRGRNGFTNHGSYGSCIERAKEKKFSTIPRWLSENKVNFADHEQGVLVHYVQDAMDRSKNASRKPGGSTEVIRDVQTILAHVLLDWSLTGTLAPPGSGAKTINTILWSISQFFSGVQGPVPAMPAGFDAKSVAPKTIYYYKSNDLNQQHPEAKRHFVVNYTSRFNWLFERNAQLQEILSMLGKSQWTNNVHWSGRIADVQQSYGLKASGTSRKNYLNGIKTIVPPIYGAYLHCTQGYPNRHQCWRCSQSAENTPAGQPWCFASFFYVDKNTPNKLIVRTKRLVPWLLEDIACIAAFSYC